MPGVECAIASLVLVPVGIMGRCASVVVQLEPVRIRWGNSLCRGVTLCEIGKKKCLIRLVFIIFIIIVLRCFLFFAGMY